MKYWVIGDEDTVLGFGIVGVSGTTASTPEEAQRAFNTALEDRETSIVIITEPVADMIRWTVNRYLFTESFPLIVEIPDRHGRDPSRPSVKQLVNSAIGIKL